MDFVCVLALLLLLWAHPSESLYIEVSAEKLYWSLSNQQRTQFFSILDYAHEGTQAGLLSILASPTYEHTFRSDYAAQTFSETQALDLINSFWTHKELHPLLLPRQLAFNDTTIVEHLVTRPIHEYSAGVMYIDAYDQEFAEHWLKMFIKPAMDDPMLCGDEALMIAGLRQGLACPWIAFDPQKQTIVLPRKDSIFIMLDYHRFQIPKNFKGLSIQLQPLLPDVVPGDDPARLAFASLCHSNDLPQFHAILSMLKQSTAAMSPTMQSLWHGKLLHLLLHRVIEKLKLTPAVVEACEFAKQAVFAFLAEYDVRAVPPFVMEALIHMLSRHASLRLSHVVPEAMHGKLMLLDQLYPTGRGFWGGLDRYIARWKANMSTAGLYTPPKDACTLWEAIEVWAEVGAEKPFGIISPVFTRPFVIVHREFRIECEDIEKFLGFFTYLLANDSAVLQTDIQDRSYIKAAPLEEEMFFWRAVARTIAYNLAYFGEERLNLNPRLWLRIYNIRERMKRYSRFKASLSRLGQELEKIGSVLKYIPLDVLQAKLPTVVVRESRTEKHKMLQGPADSSSMERSPKRRAEGPAKVKASSSRAGST